VTAGKTGTTQAYRDAWFVGFTGNYTTAVWFGNDDYTSTGRITGGSLPAMTFKKLMDFAHENIELRPIPGIENPLPDPKLRKAIAIASNEEDTLSRLERPRSLSAASTKAIKEISAALEAAPSLETTSGVTASPQRHEMSEP
jgi:penicillin-binding protein 1A